MPLLCVCCLFPLSFGGTAFPWIDSISSDDGNFAVSFTLEGGFGPSAEAGGILRIGGGAARPWVPYDGGGASILCW